MTDYGGPERRTQPEISVKLDMLHEDVNDMKAVLKDLTTAINRLALVEERQTQTAAALERAFGVIAKVEERLSAIEKREIARGEERLATLEKQAVTTTQTNDWVGKAVWAAVAAACMYVAKKAGLV